MKHFSSFAVVVSVVAASLAGCRCGPPPLTNTRPDLRVEDLTGAALGAIDLDACPTLDDNMRPVRDVFPNVKALRVANTGRAAAKAKLTISGPDADAFRLRTAGTDAGVVANPFEVDIGIQETSDFEIAFSPRKKGAHSATLTIDDQVAETTTDPVVTLIGNGLSLPAQPTLETGVELADGGFSVCAQGSLLLDCELSFPTVQFETAVTRKIVIRNRGCPALKVSAIKVASDTSGTMSSQFRLVSPPAPSSAAPLSLNSVDGTTSVEAVIEFRPTDTGVGNDVKSGFVIVDTNDPDNMAPIAQPGVLSLRGEALRPSISATPTSCDFSRPNDLCGNPTKVADRARFVIRNDGNTAVRIDDVKFKSSGQATTGQNGRFQLASSPGGMTIPSSGELVIEVSHADMPLYVIDELTLKSVFAAGGEPAGDVSFSLFGGRLPCLDTADEINFANPMTAMSAKPVFIRNQRRFSDGGTDSTQCGTLIINQVSIDQSPFFSIIDPKIAPNTQVPAGMMVETSVQYNRPPSGGMQVGKLKIASNDSSFGPPIGTKEINVISASPFDPPPQGILKGCVPAMLLNDPNCTFGSEGQMTVRLSEVTSNPKSITVSAFDSTDFDGMMMGKPTEFQFRLNPPYPANVSANTIMPNVRGTANKAVVQLPSTGLYRVNLVVWDNRGQQGSVVSLNVNVLP